MTTTTDRLWYELRLLAPREWEELLAGWLIELTGRGVTCLPAGTQAEVIAYCPSPEERASVLALAQARWGQFASELGLDSALTARETEVREEDWAENWKAYFHPLRVGERFVIKPTWEAWPPPGEPEAARAEDLVIEIDPEMAFGTGGHATTQLCLEALERHLSPGESVADIGTGSGILAIAAALLGSGPVEAWDVDPVAVEAAARNCERNRVAEVCAVREADASGELAGTWDLVLANVHTAFLLELIPRLPDMLRPGGRAILSGTTETSAEALCAALQAAGLEVVSRANGGEWISLVARKPSL
jgi:ribosomal protein L11 methyltransferase